MVRPGQSPSLVGFALLLIACALTMRTLVPAGYMLAGDGGMPRLILCDGVAAAPGHAMMHHGSGHHGDHPMPDRPCAFSAAAAAVDLVETGRILAPPPVAPVAASVHALEIRPGAGLAAPPPWQTGPPAIA